MLKVMYVHRIVNGNPEVLPINPTNRPYLGLCGSVPWVTWEVVTGVEGIPCRGFLWHTLANGAVVHPSQSGRYAEGYMALDSISPWGPCWENMEGGSVIGNFERKLRFCFYQGICKRRLWKWASLSI